MRIRFIQNCYSLPLFSKTAAHYYLRLMHCQLQILSLKKDQTNAAHQWEKERVALRGKIVEQKSRNSILDLNLYEVKQELDQTREQCDRLKTRIKLEKSYNFTELVAQMDRKWAESVARECSRAREETTTKMIEASRKQIKELTDDHEMQIARMRDEWTNLFNQLGSHAEKTKLDQVENRPEIEPYSLFSSTRLCHIWLH